MWLIYALGGGWGHLTRAIALARAVPRDRPVRILTNSPYACIVGPSLPGLDIAMLDACASAEQTRAAAMQEIAECRPSCLIVDTFPRGIGGELAAVLGTLDAHKVLIHRDLNPRYVAAVQLRPFVAAHYDLVLVPGAGEGSQLGDLPLAVETAPWLVRSADEIPDRARVRRLLHLAPDEEYCVLVCASGKRNELDWYAAVMAALRELGPGVPVRCVAAGPSLPAGVGGAVAGPGLPVRCVAAGRGVRYWPAMDLFGCAAVVVGGAGYNTVEECLAWEVPLVARPWKRAYDRQELRARRASARGRVVLVTDPEEAARAALRHMRDRPPELPRFVNGAADAASRIARLSVATEPRP